MNELSLIKTTSVWLSLITLTLIAIMTSLVKLEYEQLLMIVALITVIKGLLVADTFMDLRSAPIIWYRLMASYVILVPTIIFLIYFLS